jgi:hypothetical protein
VTGNEGSVQYTTTTIPVQTLPNAVQFSQVNECSNLYSSPYSSMGAYGNFTSANIGSLQNSVPVQGMENFNQLDMNRRFSSINSY